MVAGLATDGRLAVRDDPGTNGLVVRTVIESVLLRHQARRLAAS